MNSLSPRKELLLAYLLAAYCVYYLFTYLSLAWEFTTDDAYISWFYARQLVHGRGLHWHEHLPIVEGYSNFLWVILTTGVMKLHLPVVATMKLISITSLASGLFFLYRLSRLFFSPLVAMLPVFLFSYYEGVVWWTMSGLETSFYCALSILLIWQCAKAFGYSVVLKEHTRSTHSSTWSWIFTNITLLLLGLTRFEGLIWGVPVAVFAICHIKRMGFSIFARGYKITYVWGMITFVCFILPYAIYFIWRFNYFGYWIPNSYYCKIFTPGQSGRVDFDYFQITIPLIVCSLPYFLSSKDCRHLLLWLPSVLYGLMLWQVDPIVTYYLRLFLAPFALFTLLPVLGIYQLQIDTWDKKVTTSVIIILLTIIVIPGNNSRYMHTFMSEYAHRNQMRMDVAKILNVKSKKGDTVLLNDTGIIPFYARPDLRFIDSQCLNNATLAHGHFHPLNLYANYLHHQLKPNWVIVSQYPLEIHHEDFLTELLNKSHFFADYQQVAKLSVEKCASEATCSQKKVDYIYLIYQRQHSGF
ncbi:MAG: protein LphB [Legionella sp.]